MSDTLITVDNVSKKFCRSLKKSLWYGMQDLGNEIRGKRQGENGELRRDEFWAVKDVSFELKRGECLGLIGRNGAGKTTLLRILNGLIKPDQGRVEMRGRVGGLIALGAGFNPILSGRENIYVNASVLGLGKHEIDKKMDEIIDFAEIGDFLDSPVQSYSSGMQVRLGFAVATALEPDVLLLDEVLAVGDAAFRAKCYNRISVLMEKCAVILVSHNMDQIGQICSKAIMMHSGKSIKAGDVNECINSYNFTNETRSGQSEVHEYLASGVELDSINVSNTVNYGGEINIDIKIKIPKEIRETDIKITIFTRDGSIIAEAYTKYIDSTISLAVGSVNIKAVVGPLFLKENFYVASLLLLDRRNNEHIYWGSRMYNFHAKGPSFGSGNNLLPIKFV